MAKQNNSIDFLYAAALLYKMYKSKMISREVYEQTLQRCEQKLST